MPSLAKIGLVDLEEGEKLTYRQTDKRPYSIRKKIVRIEF